MSVRSAFPPRQQGRQWNRMGKRKIASIFGDFVNLPKHEKSIWDNIVIYALNNVDDNRRMSGVSTFYDKSVTSQARSQGIVDGG